MTKLDDKLRDLRIAKAISLVPSGARVLDVGCRDGHTLALLGDRLGEGVGIDPELPDVPDRPRIRLVKGWFPADLPADVGAFDAIIMLAIFEHIPPDEQPKFIQTCWEHLAPGGTAIMTIPSKQVDVILDVLMKIKLVKDDSVHQHYGFDARHMTVPLWEAGGFETVVHRPFQFGLNNLFQFRRPA